MGECDDIDRSVDRWCRRTARVEVIGGFDLFVEPPPFSPKYARRRHGVDLDSDDLPRLVERCRELAVPAEVEGVHESHPGLRELLRCGGWRVTEAPLMVHRDDAPPADAVVAGVRLRDVAHDSADLARIDAIGHVAFGVPGMSVGAAGPADVDRIAAGHEPTSSRERLRLGHMVMVAAFAGDDAVAYGSLLLDDAAPLAEIVAVGTVPSHRRRGLGAAVTNRLVAVARERGVTTVWLSAADADVAALYARSGFERVGTYLMSEAPA